MTMGAEGAFFSVCDKALELFLQEVQALFLCAPGMGDNLVVRVHYALGSRKR
jgi:hypothetical protein